MATRFSPGARRSSAPGQCNVQKSTGLAVLVGTAGWPRDCPNSGWVDQAWGEKQWSREGAILTQPLH